MTSLYLNLKGEYFDQIKSGEKTHEFRLASTWKKRLEGKAFDLIVIRRGYPKAGDKSKELIRVWHGYELKQITHPHFGNDPVLVYAIDVTVPYFFNLYD
ncbi:ASCH domain-containing protein [Solimicrobium silvestre]|uniref:ASCH domain-containing protein n=1 Tax=Solimicrobium silvestre TaxID=2099400 RepID=A0A2S9GY29_9BURK|nr:ASCH domain-containing protein [Solimicrobium silvestre]PRC92623.1 hypothetical protein S2091_2678 [Solimicrobium silvestre]